MKWRTSLLLNFCKYVVVSLKQCCCNFAKVLLHAYKFVVASLQLATILANSNYEQNTVVASLQLATIPAKLNDEHRLTNNDL